MTALPRLTLVTAPASEPVTTAEAKSWLRVDHSSDDALIDALVKSARQWGESFTGRAFVTQTWDAYWDGFAFGDTIVLPKAPLASVTHVKYYDSGGTLQTMTSADYAVFAPAGEMAQPGRVILNDGATWPSARGHMNDVVVRFVAGAAVASVPEGIKSAIKQLVAHWYEHRGEAAAGFSVQSVPMVVDYAFWPYRVAFF